MTPNAPGNPIFAGTGNKYQREIDYLGPGLLRVVRHYNSGLKTWVHNYMMRVQANGATAIAIRPDGKSLVFNGSGAGAWISNATAVERLTRLNSGDPGGAAWRLDTGGDAVEFYDSNGLPLSIIARGGRIVRMAYAAGALQSVTDDFGRRLTYGYDTQGRLANVSTPGGETLQYGYGVNGHLSVVTYADNTTRQYLYENSGFPYALTGLIDQNGRRFATWSYDSQGRAVSSEHAGGVERYTLTFDPNGLSVFVTDPLGAQRLLQHRNVAGRLVFAGSSQPCANCRGDAASTAVNAIGKVTQVTDFSGVASQYSYDEARRLPVGSTSAAGRPEAQTRTITWHASFRLPIVITEAGRITAYSYDNHGNTLSESVTDTASGQVRTWQRSYNAQHLVETTTDPKGGVWTYGYDSVGNLASARNPLGQQTSYARDAAGRVTTQTNPNGLVTAYTYDLRGRLHTQTRGSETNSYSYTPAGQLASVNQPDGYQITYTYDSAQRLVAVTDNRGATFQYTLDAMGNRVREEVKDANGNIELATGRVIDGLNRVAAVHGGQGQTTALTYDADGELVSVIDPLQQTSRQSLDGLRRNVVTTFADNSSSSQAWNQLDQLTEATDPKGIKTSYQTNAFGEVVSETSPDIGTISYTRDANGDIIATQDAKGQISRIERDALGRPTLIEYAQNHTVSVTYNVGGHVMRNDDKSGSTVYTRDAQGRVLTKTQIINDNPANPTHLRVAYSYEGGQLSGATYPSGLKLYYRRSAGRVTGIDLQPPPNASGKEHSVVPFVTNLSHTALGQPKSWAWNSGDTASRTFDADGRMTTSEFAGYGWDAAGRIASVTQTLWAHKTRTAAVNGKLQTVVELYQAPITWRTGYDVRNRLTRFARIGAETLYSYDTNSNRLTEMETSSSEVDLEAAFDAPNFAQSASLSSSIDPASNRLLGFAQTLTRIHAGNSISSSTSQVSYSVDANGAMTSDGLRTFEYDESRRLSKVKLLMDGEAAGVAYFHNAQGQRVFKSQPQAEQTLPSEEDLGPGFINWLRKSFGWLFTQGDSARASIGLSFAYDEDANLIGEYDNGSAQGLGSTEYIWLPLERANAIPVGIFRDGKFYQVHSDHLGTPRLVTDSSNAPVWQWPYSAFGNNRTTGVLSATTTSSGQVMLRSTKAPVVVNLRYPGQYFDAESNLSYNYLRSYRAGDGRYSQPDPIGLGGGINRFIYVEGNPLTHLDPYGLFGWADMPTAPQWAEDFGAGFGDVLTFGTSDAIRDQFDIGGVDRCSGAYTAGEVTGVVASIATGFAGGTKAVAKASSPNNWANFSHSGTPASWNRGTRWSRTGNRANGDYIPTTGKRPDLHDLMDATAAGVGGNYPTWPAWRRAMNRMPYTPGSALYGGASAAMSNCGCRK